MIFDGHCWPDSKVGRLIMNRIVAALKSYISYLQHVLRRRAKSAADDEEDPFIYPHS
jgi:hypothetical protein